MFKIGDKVKFLNTERVWIVQDVYESDVEVTGIVAYGLRNEEDKHLFAYEDELVNYE